MTLSHFVRLVVVVVLRKGGEYVHRRPFVSSFPFVYFGRVPPSPIHCPASSSFSCQKGLSQPTIIHATSANAATTAARVINGTREALSVATLHVSEDDNLALVFSSQL